MAHISPWLAAALVSALVMFSVIEPPQGDEVTTLRAGKVYRAVVPATTYDVEGILTSAKRLGFWVRVAQGANVTYFKGSDPCMTCDPTREEEFFKAPALYVDGGLVLIRWEEAAYRLIVRPSSAQKPAQEAILLPQVDLQEPNATTEVLQRLLQLQVLAGPAVIGFGEVEYPAKPKPADVALDPTLYALQLAPDWHEFARMAGVPMWGLRARVVIELTSATAQLQGAHNLIVEARSASGLMRVLVPVHELSTLAKDPAVRLVRPPLPSA